MRSAAGTSGGARASARARVDGVPCAAEDARVAALDRGFLHGDGVFEVYRAYGGRPFLEEAHLRRLMVSARRIGLDPPIAPEALSVEVAATLAELGTREAHVRVVLTRGVGGGGLAPTEPTVPTRLIVVTPLTAPPESLYADGIAVCFAASPRWLAGVGGSGAKVCNYVDAILAVGAARSHGAAEALFTDPHGQVLEGATSNVFAVRDGRVETPPVQAGILPGITRDAVLELARAEGRVATPRCLFPSDLYGAQEVFLTSSIREVVPVVAIDGHPVGSGDPGPVALGLLRAYREQARRRPGVPSD